MTQIFFERLKGEWEFQRQISGFGSVAGRASFVSVGECLSYLENGLLKHVKGGTYVTEKKYEYLYNAQKDVIEVYFVVDSARGSLFCELDFVQGKAAAQHVCSKDVYAINYLAKNENNFEIIYQVTGPKKAYTAVTNFSRIS